MLALLAALLAFAYATLSLRRLFQGEYIGAWREFGQVETYAYSALWLALGVALLVGGLFLKSQVLRIASGALIVVAVAKVFLFDMSELEGVLRALSFIGLGDRADRHRPVLPAHAAAGARRYSAAAGSPLHRSLADRCQEEHRHMSKISALGGPFCIRPAVAKNQIIGSTLQLP